MSLFVIVAILDDTAPTTFPRNNWPLHLTLLGNFSTNLREEELLPILSEITERTTAFDIIGRSQSFFGVQKNIPVIEVAKSDELLFLHEQLLRSLQTTVTFEKPNYVGIGYIPHVTNQINSRIVVREKRRVINFSLVQLEKNEGHICFSLDLKTNS